MPLTTGCNHIALLTPDLDRLIAFYTSVFEAEVTMDLSEGPLRHALLDFGGGFQLHPFQVTGGTDQDQGSMTMFQRGHIDHFALNAPDDETFQELRRRLVEAGATEGRVRDFGVVSLIAFSDPDGMECELAIWREGAPLTMAQSKTQDYTASTSSVSA